MHFTQLLETSCRCRQAPDEEVLGREVCLGTVLDHTADNAPPNPLTFHSFDLVTNPGLGMAAGADPDYLPAARPGRLTGRRHGA